MVDATLSILEKALDMRMRAHEIHASNVANANVPGFKARKIEFEESLRGAAESLEIEGLPMRARESRAAAEVQDVSANLVDDPLAKASADGNTVNMEREQTEIAKNTILYQGTTQIISKKLALQKYVLSEGGR